MVAVDLISRAVDSPNEPPLGIFTAAFGAPFFIWLLRHNTTVNTPSPSPAERNTTTKPATSQHPCTDSPNHTNTGRSSRR
ncbi:MAG TPA: iron chelate uptake ABC transporter family permease subunit [Amycolatopsis sp.]|uniref:iron chelate uptake ABC transporter family permease subunit n=1 Tax=Amycolatopsis sp. TaxID=37632 RepID=UPI002B4983C7|nr:iron chelate uptake ABC transporter family permease subunit [Amycolatopsis sp.]HKS48192.1 iron chelate uptake ABC transporter family permease subunit [Amycolatopsis sp.]